MNIVLSRPLLRVRKSWRARELVVCWCTSVERRAKVALPLRLLVSLGLWLLVSLPLRLLVPLHLRLLVLLYLRLLAPLHLGLLAPLDLWLLRWMLRTRRVNVLGQEFFGYFVFYTAEVWFGCCNRVCEAVDDHVILIVKFKVVIFVIGHCHRTFCKMLQKPSSHVVTNAKDPCRFKAVHTYGQNASVQRPALFL